MNVRMAPSWKQMLEPEFQKPYFSSLVSFVKKEYETNPGAIFPPASLIFKAFDACPFEEVKVVVLGQDPYPTRGHAMGLCFSVNPLLKWRLISMGKPRCVIVECHPNG